MLITDFNGNILEQHEWSNAVEHCGGGFVIPRKKLGYIYQGYLDTVISNGDAPCPSYIALMDSDFNILSRAIYNKAVDNAIYNVRQLQDSFIVFVGFTTYNLYGWLGKLEKNGNKLWEREFQHGISGFNIFADFQQTPWDQGFIVTGGTVDNYNQNLWPGELDSNGMLLPDSINTGTFQVSNEKTELKLYPNPAENETIVQYNVFSD